MENGYDRRRRDARDHERARALQRERAYRRRRIRERAVGSWRK